MNRNFRVIKIDGIKGLVIAAFIVCCLIAGFLSFPGWVCMHVWNFIAGYFSQMPQMNLLHGIILWTILALSYYALNKGNFSISFGSPKSLPSSEARLKEILRRIHEENASVMNVDKDFFQSERSNIDETSDSDSEEKTVK